MLKVTIWMNMPSFYQDELYRGLAASGEVDLRVIFAQNLPTDRKGLGWSDSTGAYPQQTLQGWKAIPSAIRLAWTQRKRLHIVNGIWSVPAFSAALTVFGITGGTFAILSEPPNPSLSRSRQKQLIRQKFGRWVASRAGAKVLPISPLAKEFFSKLGFAEAAIYPFLYTRSHSADAGSAACELQGDGLDILFVGQLIHRKGVDLLLEAFAPLQSTHQNVRLTLVGDGEARAELTGLVDTLCIRNRVAFEGVIPSGEIRSKIARADLLVLPSRWDGWGLVVNEAFSVGTPVLVSNACGAAEIVKDGVNGYIFRSEDVESLRASLMVFLATPRDPAMRAAARVTGDSISVEAVMPYLLRSLRHMTGQDTNKPRPPWLSAEHLAT